MLSGRVRIGRIRRVKHLVRDDESIAGFDHRIGRRGAEDVHRPEEIALEDVGPAGDLLLRQTVLGTRALKGRVRINAIHHLANVPHRRHIDLAVAMLFSLAVRTESSVVGVLKGRPCTADVRDRIRVASVVAKELPEAFCIDDVVTKACIVSDGECPHVCLALVQGASFLAFESGNG